MQVTTLDAALQYAERGLHVFPIRYGQKKPATKNGFHDASTDPATLHSWFATRKFNIGIATGEKSGLAVIDVDLYAGGTVATLEAELGALPETSKAKTRAGGEHLIYKYPAGAVIGSYNGKIAPHVDIKANGGYIVAAPSFVDEDDKGPAGFYEWQNDLPPADLPPAWVKRLASLAEQKKARPSSTPSELDDLTAHAGYTPPDSVEDGGRNDAVLRYSSHLRGKRMPESLILEAARDFNRARCNPPLDDDEVADIVSRYPKPEPADPDGWPEPKEIKAALPEVPPFDMKLLPSVFSEFCADVTERMQCPPDYIAVALMVAAAAVVGNRLAICPKREDTGWKVVPNLYGGVVGRPGVMKSPALSEVLRFLSTLESEAIAEHEKALAEYEARKISYTANKARLEKAAKGGATITAAEILPEPEAPQPKRYVVHDATYQALGEVLRHNPAGVLNFRDELTGLIASLDAEGQESARGFLLTAWNGSDPYTFERIGRGNFRIGRLCLSLLGGIQPGRLAEYLRGAVSGGRSDDGLMQREQMLVWPDISKEWRNIDRRPDPAAREAVMAKFRWLAMFKPEEVGATVPEFGFDEMPHLHFDDKAQAIFDKWREGLEHALRGTERHPALESHFSKYRKLVPALALLIHLVEVGKGPVGADSLVKAVHWSKYLKKHAERVYSSVTNRIQHSAEQLATRIKAGKLDSPFTVRQVYRNGWHALTVPDDVREAVEMLVEAGWLRGETVSTDGRATTHYYINPKIR